MSTTRMDRNSAARFSCVVSNAAALVATMRAAMECARRLIADGKRALIQVIDHDDSLTARQRRFMHGVVLPQISEQVRVDGVRYATRIWKEHLRATILGSTWETRKMPGDKEPRAYEMRVSTEDLGVRLYSEYIDRVLAMAVTDWGVQFEFRDGEREGVRYVSRAGNKPPVEKAEAC